MSKSVKINGVTYESVPEIDIPLSTGKGSAKFYDTSGASGAAGDVLSGKTFFGVSGPMTGSMPNNGAVTGTLAKKADVYTVPAGYHNGGGKVGISATEQAKIIEGNIRAGVSILGVAGKSTVVDTSISTGGASASTIVAGSSAYVNGTLVSGALTLVKVTQDSSTKVLSIA